MEKRFPAESPPGLDFGASWARFWEVLGSNFYSFYKKFAERWGAFAIKDRFENLPSASLQKERRFPFHVKSGLSWGVFGAQDASKTAQDASKNPKRRQDAPKTPQDAPKTPPRRPKTPQEVPRRSPRRTEIHPDSILMLETLKIKKAMKNKGKSMIFKVSGLTFRS